MASDEQTDRLIQAVARVAGFLELISHDISQQVRATDDLTEAVYTLAAIKVAAANGVDPDLTQLNEDVQAWLRSRVLTPQEGVTT